MLLLIFGTIDTILIHFSGEATCNFLLGSMWGISSQFAGVVGNLVCCLFYSLSKLYRCCSSCTLYWRRAESAEIHNLPVHSSLSCLLCLAPRNCHGMYLYISAPVLGVFESFCRKYIMKLECCAFQSSRYTCRGKENNMSFFKKKNQLKLVQHTQQCLCCSISNIKYSYCPYPLLWKLRGMFTSF